MTHRLDIHFLLFYEDHHPIENHVQYAVRHEIAKMFMDAGFGGIGEAGNELFINEFAVPSEDQYIDNELSIFFSFNVQELQENQRNLDIHHIVQFQSLIREQYQMVGVIIQRFIS